MILIYMMVLCTQVNKMYVIATLSVYPHRFDFDQSRARILNSERRTYINSIYTSL